MPHVQRCQRAIDGIVQDLHRCPVCTKLRAQAEGAPLPDNGWQPADRRLVHVPGCPAWEPATVAEGLARCG